MSGKSSLWRWRFVAALAMFGLPAAALVWQAISEAGAPPFAPRVLASFKDQQLTVSVALPASEKPVTGKISAALLDAAGKTLDTRESKLTKFDPEVEAAFAFPNVNKADADKLRVLVKFKNKQAEFALAKILLGKGHETTIHAGTDFHAGSQASIQCSVQGIRNAIESVPHAGSNVAIHLIDGKKTRIHLHSGLTDKDGKLLANFDVPALEPGTYTLEIVTKSAHGEEKLERQVQIRSDGKILLVSDKPVYQPGQLIHLRTLALRSFDMKPLEGKEMLLEIEDSKGNKVFKRTLKTSDFGVASVDFQLADEVNMGNYTIRAAIPFTPNSSPPVGRGGAMAQAEKTVQVKRYVLPRFKVEVKADKTFYLPKEKIAVDLQSDYFFGKPVANSQVEVSASTFDVAFKEFAKWKGTTDANGHAKFDIQLPDYFVGQPLQAGNAIVKLEVTVLDNAEHKEKVTKSYAVSEQPIQVSVMPEGGKLAAGLENRLFVAALYPDGSPAPNTEIKVWHQRQPNANQPWRGGRFGRGMPIMPQLPPQPVAQPAKDAKEEKLPDPLAVLKTNAAGLAEIKITPAHTEFRVGGWGSEHIELVGGDQERWGPHMVYDLRIDAKDPRGNQSRSTFTLSTHPHGESVLLRLDKAIYQAGERINIDIRSSAGLPTVYVDIVRNGQIMLSKWLEVKAGSAAHALDLPPAVFGTLEIHAYQMLWTGKIVRDSRVAYVQPRSDLKITATPGKEVHEPGENGRIRFLVTDQAGKPAQAALGVIVVDEAVYALQDLQPGLEKVYFTLQEELLKPSAQIKFSPGESIDGIVRQPVVPAGKQQIAEALLTSVKLPAPKRWDVNPAADRKRIVDSHLRHVAAMLQQVAWESDNVIEFDKREKRWVFRQGLLDDMLKNNRLQPAHLDNGFGGRFTLDDFARLEKSFTAENLGMGITTQRLQQWQHQLGNYASLIKQTAYKDGRWTLPDNALELSLKAGAIDKRWLKDGFGQPFQLVRKNRKPGKESQSVLDDYDVVSPGPDGKIGTADDITLSKALSEPYRFGGLASAWWLGEGYVAAAKFDDFRDLLLVERDRAVMERMHAIPMPGVPGAAPGGLGGGGAKNARGGVDMAEGARRGESAQSGAPGAAPRVREFFPETMLWQPALITDEKGIADLSINFADSITTWRLSASANAKSGAIGGAAVPLKVFQDFFVDIDLPVHLTQSDEIAFPVAVYNYLKTPQTVKIELQKEEWFELLEPQGQPSLGLVRTLELQPNEVTSVKFRIRAGKIGWQPLTVKAFGSKKSDAVKRIVEVVPNGQKIEKNYSDRLVGSISHTIDIPEKAIPDASKLMVKIFPGAMAQVVDGLDGMLRMPNGCFEQTSSSAYPNVLIVDYIKKNRIASPAMLMKAENYLNVGYQRLLTFERPGGGFDWWGREEPLIWTSAYGLQEFSDMARVYPIDRGVIERTQGFLMRKRDKDGTWSNIGATHGETIASMGNPKLLLTSYVTWSLLESGYDKKQLQVSVDYIRNNLDAAGDNGYILALAANALAAFDSRDDSTLQCLQKLDRLRIEEKQLKVQFLPARGTSLTYGRGDSVAVETTALAALAMMKTGGFNASVNQSLAYLVKTKQASGTWGTTQATILALKALLSGMGGGELKEDVFFTIKLNGQGAVRGKIAKADADVMQSFELKGFKQTGANTVQIEVNGETNLMYQIVSRHFEAWQKQLEPEQPAIDVKVEYDRTRLSTKDILKAKATLKYSGKIPTYMVMLDLGIAPGFSVDPGDFAEMVNTNKVKKFEITARQVILYLGDVRPGDELTFEYVLRPRYPLRARTPASTAYEYNTPGVRATANPVELTVEEKK